jgi:small subunit ribosomal protein S17
MTTNRANDKKTKRILTGEVISDKMDKTIVVKTVFTFMDPLFHKIRKKVKNYKVHDEQEVAKMGDTVEFYEGRPVSRHKYMYLARVVNSQ